MAESQSGWNSLLATFKNRFLLHLHRYRLGVVSFKSLYSKLSKTLSHYKTECGLI